MFKITFSLFLLLFVARSVSSLKCLVTQAKECPSQNIHNPCLSSHYKSQECKPPNVCVRGVYFPSGTTSKGPKIYVRDCIQYDEACHNLFDPIFGQNTIGGQAPYTCGKCSNADNCNLDLHLDMKKLKGHKNSTTPPSAASKEKSGGSRSYRITIMLQTSILFHIISILHTFF